MQELILPSDVPKQNNNSSEWPLLFKNYTSLNIKSSHYTPMSNGYTPLSRPIKEYLKYGVINLDKPSNPSSHEVVAWIKRILKVEKTGHSGTLDPKVSGCLIVCIDKATRLAKSQQQMGKEYVCIMRVHESLEKIFDTNNKDIIFKELQNSMDKFKGVLFQKPPLISAVKRELRLRQLYDIKLYDVDLENNMVLFNVDVQSGFYVRTLCVHLGLELGCGAHMEELRRVRSGTFSEEKNMVTMHDIKTAMMRYTEFQDESYLRRVILPMESLVMNYKRIVIKDSTVNSICYGAKLMMPGVLRFENGIEREEIIVLMTTKGEAVALGIAKMITQEIETCDHGIVSAIKRVLMDKDLYNRQWGLGPRALRKKKLIEMNLLTEKGKPCEGTPKDWVEFYIDEQNNNIIEKK